ncbi:MAG: VWA domain-containing protein [Deltaproteobacteria bacterium]|nr:MAG: VWA domain-containing protein [Deltaproteobacteria bacterium]
MIEWASPWWLLGILPALLVPWWGRGPRLRHASVAAIAQGRSLRTALAWVPRALGSAALVLICVALARPQLVDRERIVDSEGIDIMLVLDTSGSMEAEDYTLNGRPASRLEVAKEVIADFVAGRPNDRIGLVVFGEEAFTQVPLTLDHDALIEILRQVVLGVAGRRATALGDAMAVAGARLKDLDAPSKVMILLTDGRNNAGQVPPLEAAEAARALGIRVYTVGIGTTGGGGLRGFFTGRGGDLDEKTLQAIARITNARYFRADDTQALRDVYATIDQLERSTAEAREFVHTEERYHGWLIGGLLLLALQLLLGETWLRRLP